MCLNDAKLPPCAQTEVRIEKEQNALVVQI